MQTATEKTESKESNKEPVIEEGNSSKESEQKMQSVDEILTEIIHSNKIAEDTQTEQDPNVADADGAAETSATESRTIEEPGISKIFEAIQIITQSQGDVPGEQATGKIFEAIRKMIQSHADLPGQPVTEEKSTPDITGCLSEICANDIMQKQVTWASPEDSLQQAITKMQQTDAGYIMVGQNETLEGIVSKSDIAKATSPYLLPIFAKWRRPLDDATLKIRIKWIMSGPVRTTKLQTSLATIMEQMGRFRVRCLPVLDEEGNVRGLVTAFDVFQTLLKSNSNTCSTEEASRELVKTASSTETTQRPSSVN
jgi:CBS domain-containing protein